MLMFWIRICIIIIIDIDIDMSWNGTARESSVGTLGHDDTIAIYDSL